MVSDQASSGVSRGDGRSARGRATGNALSDAPARSRDQQHRGAATTARAAFDPDRRMDPSPPQAQACRVVSMRIRSREAGISLTISAHRKHLTRRTSSSYDPGTATDRASDATDKRGIAPAVVILNVCIRTLRSTSRTLQCGLSVTAQAGTIRNVKGWRWPRAHPLPAITPPDRGCGVPATMRLWRGWLDGNLDRSQAGLVQRFGPAAAPPPPPPPPPPPST